MATKVKKALSRAHHCWIFEILFFSSCLLILPIPFYTFCIFCPTLKSLIWSSRILQTGLYTLFFPFVVSHKNNPTQCNIQNWQILASIVCFFFFILLGKGFFILDLSLSLFFPPLSSLPPIIINFTHSRVLLHFKYSDSPPFFFF